MFGDSRLIKFRRRLAVALQHYMDKNSLRQSDICRLLKIQDVTINNLLHTTKSSSSMVTQRKVLKLLGFNNFNSDWVTMNLLVNQYWRENKLDENCMKTIDKAKNV